MVRFLVSVVAPAEDRVFVLDDLAEEFGHRLSRDGVAAARRWYRLQALRSLPPLFVRRVGVWRSRAGLPTLSLLVDRAGQDVRFTLRSLRRRPSFAIVAIVTLAIAFGANMAVFGIMNALLMRPVRAVADADRLVEISRDLDGGYFDMSYPVLERLSASNVLSELAPIAMGACRGKHGGGARGTRESVGDGVVLLRSRSGSGAGSVLPSG